MNYQPRSLQPIATEQLPSSTTEGSPLDHEPAASEKSRKPSRLVRGGCFLAFAICAGAGIGIGWLSPQNSWAGILGTGVFLVAQLRHAELRYRLLSALIAGYVAFLITNAWLPNTILSVGDGNLSSLKANYISHFIHLFHAGNFCLFAFFWWACTKYLRHGWTLAPFALVLADYLYPGLYPMRQGCLLAEVNTLVQPVAIFGVGFATVQMVVIASLIPALLIMTRMMTPKLPVASKDADQKSLHAPLLALFATTIIILLTTLNFLYGCSRISQFEIATANQQLPQMNILCVQQDTEYAQFNAELIRKTKEASVDPDLVVWPECSLGTYDQDLKSFSNRGKVAKMSVGIGQQFQPWPDATAPLLAGGYSYVRLKSDQPAEPGGRAITMAKKFVSAYLFDSDETVIGRHDKTNLMAGGEYTPIASWFPTLSAWLFQADVEQEVYPDDDQIIQLSAGDVIQPVGEVKGMSIGGMLCCEDMYAPIARTLVQNGTDLLICVANGMSFDSDPALHQHYVISRYRALENNRYFIRCGSYGKTCLISPVGTIVKDIDTFEPGEMQLTIPIEDRSTTPYTRWGNWLLFGVAPVCYLGLRWGFSAFDGSKQK